MELIRKFNEYITQQVWLIEKYFLDNAHNIIDIITFGMIVIAFLLIGFLTIKALSTLLRKENHG